MALEGFDDLAADGDVEDLAEDASVDAMPDDAEETAPTDIIGTADSPILDQWTVEYRFAEPNSLAPSGGEGQGEGASVICPRPSALCPLSFCLARNPFSPGFH